MQESSSHTNQEVKSYLDRRFSQEDDLTHFIRVHSELEKLPEIQIPLHVGKLIYLLGKIQMPKKILEIGTLGGYSTAWLAKALMPHGRLISIEINSQRAATAQKLFDRIKDKHIEIRTGHAIELLAQMSAANEGPFDLIFIDADKDNNALYLDWSISLSRSGTLILIDNLIPKGKKVGYPANEEAKSIYAFNDYLAQHPMVETTVVPTLVGSQARLDGLAIVRVK